MSEQLKFNEAHPLAADLLLSMSVVAIASTIGIGVSLANNHPENAGKAGAVLLGDSLLAATVYAGARRNSPTDIPKYLK
jgi:hypothetical protein